MLFHPRLLHAWCICQYVSTEKVIIYFCWIYLDYNRVRMYITNITLSFGGPCLSQYRERINAKMPSISGINHFRQVPPLFYIKNYGWNLAYYALFKHLQQLQTPCWSVTKEPCQQCRNHESASTTFWYQSLTAWHMGIIDNKDIFRMSNVKLEAKVFTFDRMR